MANVPTKRNENRVTVVDPKGGIHELSKRNANDLVQNLGWTFQSTVDPKNANAHAPRTPRGRQTIEDKIAGKSAAAEKPARAAKKARPTAPPVVDADSPDDPVPYDQSQQDPSLASTDDDFAALEAEEEARNPKDDTAE